jgi:TPR repeat protein
MYVTIYHKVSSYMGMGMLLNFTRLFFVFLIILFHITPGFTTDTPDNTDSPPLVKRTSALNVDQTNILRRAEAGDTESQISMAKFYYEQKDAKDETEGNRIEAAKWLKLAAEKEHAEALHLLGKCHYYGLGTQLNQTLAVIYYLRSATLNFAPAQYDVAKCYYYGICVTQNRFTAVFLGTAAAEQGLISAEFFLAQCYFTGQGAAPNREEAYKWCAKAAEKDHEIGIIAKRYIKKNGLNIP